MSTSVSDHRNQDSEALSRLCQAVESDLDHFSDSITERVLVEIPTFSRLPFAEQQDIRRKLISIILPALAAGAGPTPEELQIVRATARRRLLFGLPVADVLATLHIFSVELWKKLLEESDGPEDAEAVAELLGVHWVWVQAMSGAVAEVYAEEVSIRKGREVSLRHRLLEALRGGGAMLEEALESARELRFDPDGEFQAFCAPAAAWSPEQVGRLQGRLSRLPGVVHCGQRDQTLVVLAQGVDALEVSSRIDDQDRARGVFGVGLPRPTLPGAELSISDATRALALAEPGATGAVRFEDHWLEASLVGSRDRIEPLLSAGRDVAREHPHIADAVRAFARGGFSISRAAEDLVVHPNTAAYRLARWEELTGWDPRGLQGFLLSVVALELQRAADPGDLER